MAPLTAQARDIVPFRGYEPGTIVVVTSARQLYYVLPGGQAIRYPVGVGRAGMAWHGRRLCGGKISASGLERETRRDPDHSRRLAAQPDGRRRARPRPRQLRHPRHQQSASIGGFVSHGCIRMYNADIMDLYARVPIGAEVAVVP